MSEGWSLGMNNRLIWFVCNSLSSRHECYPHDTSARTGRRVISVLQNFLLLVFLCFCGLSTPIDIIHHCNLIASSLVSSRLDYANACLFSISVKNTARLQRVQNTLARVITRSKPRTSTAPLLKHLHWLPVSYRIQYKIALLTYKSFHSTAPPYLSSLIQSYNPTRTRRSSSAHKLITPPVRTCFGSRGFRAAGPTIWNSLPCAVKNMHIYS